MSRTYRRTIRAAFKETDKFLRDGHTTTKADQILALIVESGLLYCVTAVSDILLAIIQREDAQYPSRQCC